MADVDILHLSDIHAGAQTFKDMDGKVAVAGATVASPLELLSTYLEALPRQPDFVVVSGDITIKGDNAGLQEVREWILKEIGKGALPPAERILVVPGNHDVTRLSRKSDDPKTQFRNFWTVFGRTFPHAHVPDFDPTTKSSAAKAPNSGLLGGIEVAVANGETALTSSLPYIVDLNSDVLIYGFNSAHGSGVPLDPDDKIAGRLASLIDVAGPDSKAALTGVREAYLNSLVVDAGMLTQPQIVAFNEHMKTLRASLGDRYEKLTKIAVLHHHVSHLWQQQLELKAFETVIEASQFKQALTEHAFDLVLHGHKHTNHVGIDGALIPVDRTDRFNPLCVISGGTVGGHPRPNDRQSFKLIELPGKGGPRRTAVVREVPLLPVNMPGDVISRDSRLYNLPLGDRFPGLHDLPGVKNALDKTLVERLAPELAADSSDVAQPYRLSTAVKDLFASTLPYNCYAFHDAGDGVFYEVLQATRKLKFGTISRLQWLVTAAEHWAERKARAAKVVVLIGDLEKTHYSEASQPGEIVKSIEQLKAWLAPAIASGKVEVRDVAFTQDDVAAITQAVTS